MMSWKSTALGLFLLVVLAACGVDYTRLTSTRFADWNGRPPDPELLKTGDVILRLMDSPQGAVLAGLSRGHFSHVGILFFRAGRPWVADCLGLNPRPAVKTEPLAEFLSSKCYHDTIQVSCLGFLPTYFRFDVDYSEEMVHYLVLRLERPLDQERFLRVLDEYLRHTTLYDYAYRLDNDDEDARRLYCSEFVWRVLEDATGEELGLAVQASGQTTENIKEIEKILYSPPVLNAIRQRYGSDFLTYMRKVAENDKGTLKEMPPDTPMLMPDAFFLSSAFRPVLYSASPAFLEECPEFFDHFRTIVSERFPGTEGTAFGSLPKPKDSSSRSGGGMEYLRGLMSWTAPRSWSCPE